MESVAAAPRNTLAPYRRRSAMLAGATVLLLVLPACGGDDDESAESTTTSTIADLAVTTTTEPEATVLAVTTTTTTAATAAGAELALVTEGATVIVANASGVDGGAGRMSDALAAAGFTTGAATNSSESGLKTTKIYYAAANEQAQAVAESVKAALGGGDIEVLELPDPAPLGDPTTLGDAGVLVAMGNDVVDTTLAELQSGVAANEVTTESSVDSSTESSTESSVGG